MLPPRVVRLSALRYALTSTTPMTGVGAGAPSCSPIETSTDVVRRPHQRWETSEGVHRSWARVLPAPFQEHGHCARPFLPFF